MEGAGLISDWLNAARQEALGRTNARSIYVLPPGGFADFRLDGPPGISMCFDEDGNGFHRLERNGLIYLRMGERWYRLFAEECNHLPMPEDRGIDDADLHLCIRILQAGEKGSAIDRQDLPLMRHAMELPGGMGRWTPRKRQEVLRNLGSALRARNARALARGECRYGLRACAAIIFAFFQCYALK